VAEIQRFDWDHDGMDYESAGYYVRFADHQERVKELEEEKAFAHTELHRAQTRLATGNAELQAALQDLVSLREAVEGEVERLRTIARGDGVAPLLADGIANQLQDILDRSKEAGQ
jgi:multidrug resistance efflux pump